MQNTLMMRPFGARDKIGYLLGNMANDFTFNFASVFLLVFYTKVLGISGALVGTMFLVARFIDAFTDVAMGRIVDRTRSGSNGKFRPWILRFCGPVALASFLMYQSSLASASLAVRVTYMFVTYFLWGSVFYTAVNIPYGSMASVISADATHRASLSTMRSVGSVIAGLIIGVGAPLFIYVTDENGNQTVRSEAFPIIAGVLAVVSIIFYLLCYFLTTERISVPPAREHHSFSQTMGALVTNRALIGIIIASICVLAAQLLSQAINQYLFIDYFNDKNGVMIITVLGMLPTLLLAPFATTLSKRFGKKEIGIVGSIGAALSGLLLFFLRTRDMWVYIVISLVGFLGFGVFNLITWAFITDIIDDREVKTGNRDDGTIYAVYSFARKVGQAIAGGLGGWMLSVIGFDESAIVQSAAVKSGIYTVSTLIPAILYLAVGAALAFVYPLNRQRVESNVKALLKRHENEKSE